MDALETSANGTRTPVNGGNKPTKDAKQRRHLPSKPSATSATEMTAVIYNGLSDKTPVEWSFLKNYEIFSLSLGPMLDTQGQCAFIRSGRGGPVDLVNKKALSGKCLLFVKPLTAPLR